MCPNAWQDVAECGPSGWPLERIAVDRQGNFVLLEPSVVCDACPACEDTCRLAKCRGCEDKRRALGRLGPVQQQGRGAGAAAGARQLKEYAYTLCEVRRHRTLASCWLVAKGQVYDVTPYLAHHPAGAVAIARKAGGLDCTEDLEFHSPRAQKLWRQFRIGVVKACPGNHGYGHGHGPRVSGASVSQGQGQGQGGLCGGGEAGATPSAFAASGPDALDGPSICSVM
jgi:cytochrome b involved in lipid metabolism